MARVGVALTAAGGEVGGADDLTEIDGADLSTIAVRSDSGVGVCRSTERHVERRCPVTERPLQEGDSPDRRVRDRHSGAAQVTHWRPGKRCRTPSMCRRSARGVHRDRVGGPSFCTCQALPRKSRCLLELPPPTSGTRSGWPTAVILGQVRPLARADRSMLLCLVKPCFGFGQEVSDPLGEMLGAGV